MSLGLALKFTAAPLLKGVGFSLPAFMAGQSDGLWSDFSATSRLFQGTDETTPVTAVNDVIGRVNDRRTGTNSPRNATQATASLKPKYQTTGAAFDGSDDNLLTGYTAGAGANFIVAKVTVPASLATFQFVAGARQAGIERFALGFDNVGFVTGAVGNNTVTTIVGNTDRRGQTVVVGITCNGSTVRLFDVNAVAYEAAQSGAPTTATAFRLGAWNDGGAAGAFFAGSIRSLVVGRQFLDLATFNKIAAAL